MNKIVLIFLLLALIPIIAFSGSLAEKRAHALYEKEFYFDAIEKYLKLADKGKVNVNVATRLAHSYRKVNDFTSAANWYAQAVTFDGVDPDVYFYYAEMLKTMDQHSEAFQWIEKYAALNPNDNRAAEILKDPDYINTIDITSLYGALTRLETEYNGSEFGIAFLNQQQVVFSSGRDYESVMNHNNKRENRPFYNLYKADINNWKLENIRPFDGAVNSDLHEGPVVFSAEGKEIYFTRNQFINRSRFRSNPINNLMIYKAIFDGTQWTNVEPMPFNSPDYSCGHPAISPDGKKLYFVSDMPGGMGDTDIYMVEKTDNGWTAPQNLGERINTAGREVFPFIARNGTLYFSSDGHLSLGSLDIFSAEKYGDGFLDPVNLGYPVNSGADDFAFVLANDLENGFFSSNRQDTSKDEFYHFKVMKRPDIFALDLVIKDKESSEIIPGVSIIFMGENRDDAVSDRNGTISIDFDKTQSFTLGLRKEGYLADDMRVSTRKRIRGQTLEKEALYLEKITQDISFDLDIFFASGKADISEEASADLNEKALRFLQNNPQVVIELSAHTDSRGDTGSNLRLSEERAQSARQYLLSKGIAPERIIAKGYGESRLRNHCRKGVQCSDEEHQQNRRVEIRVLSF